MKNHIDISLVIPTYNEEKNIRKALTAILDFLRSQNYSFELIVSDDGSNDRTREIISSFQKDDENIVLNANPHRGKGSTLISGFKKARGDIVIFSDADLATPISEVDKFLAKFRQGYDVVIGSRGFKRKGAPLLRQILAQGFNILVQLFLLPGISDTQCGFKAFKKDALAKILAKMRLYSKAQEVRGSAVTAGFDVEALFIAKKLRLKIGQVPVVWHHVGTEGVRPLKDSIAAFLDILKIRLNDWRGIY